MSIAIECPSCRAAFQVPERLDGKKIRCKTCREEFRVTVDEPDDDYDDEPRPRRGRKKSSPLIGLLIAGGIVAGCLVVAVVVVLVIAGAMNVKEQKQVFAAQPPQMRGPPQPQAQPAVVRTRTFPDAMVTPMPPTRRIGRPAEPPEGPITVTLSNPRRAEADLGGDPRFQVDFTAQSLPAGGMDWFYLVVKGEKGLGEAHLFRFSDRPQGALTFKFFPTFKPGTTFEIWIEQEPPGKSTQRKRISKPVTLQ